MKVILTSDLPNVGRAGQAVEWLVAMAAII